jgi:ferredoxin
MPYVVAEPCIKCKYTDCADVCPVDCFHEGPNMLVIDPEVCIDCGACEPVCPPRAIFTDDTLPEPWREYLALNAELSRRWPVIREKKEPLPEAERWRYQPDKGALLDRS